ncbi:MAG: ChbG/HpnK family deacetylase [Bacteroidetes bacterium]|nr:ChbG/HpnK family deacetylase [Bacteroidota bacterium]
MSDKLLIVNADDFGLHDSINSGIIDSCQNGIVRSISVCPSGEAFERGVAELRRMNLDLDIGVHLTFIEEAPLSPQSEISSLLTKSGTFFSNYSVFMVQYLKGRVNTAELLIEGRRQIERVLGAGLNPIHLDSHQHVHCFPPIWHVVTKLAKQFRIPFIRLSHFDRLLGNRSAKETIIATGVNILSWANGKYRVPPEISTIRTAGLSNAGKLDQQRFESTLENLSPGVHEFVSHPGYNTDSLEQRYHWGYHWSLESQTLQSNAVKNMLADYGVNLTTFSQVLSCSSQSENRLG